MQAFTVGEFLKENRAKKKMTQLQVAKYLNVSPQAVSKWERCESLPDITLLPEIAQLYGVRVEDILNPDAEEKQDGYETIIEQINSLVDSQLYAGIYEEFKVAEKVSDLTVPFDIFLFLNNDQKETLLDLLFEMEDYGNVIDEVLQYTNGEQRNRMIQRVLAKRDYENLEVLIPFMPRSVRTEIVEHLLVQEQYDFIEDMLPFLNREQKNLIIQHVFKEEISYEILENFIPFFDSRQRRLIQDWYEDRI